MSLCLFAYLVELFIHAKKIRQMREEISKNQIELRLLSILKRLKMILIFLGIFDRRLESELKIFVTATHLLSLNVVDLKVNNWIETDINVHLFWIKDKFNLQTFGHKKQSQLLQKELQHLNKLHKTCTNDSKACEKLQLKFCGWEFSFN